MDHGITELFPKFSHGLVAGSADFRIEPRTQRLEHIVMVVMWCKPWMDVEASGSQNPLQILQARFPLAMLNGTYS